MNIGLKEQRIDEWKQSVNMEPSCKVLSKIGITTWNQSFCFFSSNFAVLKNCSLTFVQIPI